MGWVVSESLASARPTATASQIGQLVDACIQVMRISCIVDRMAYRAVASTPRPWKPTVASIQVGATFRLAQRPHGCGQLSDILMHQARRPREAEGRGRGTRRPETWVWWRGSHGSATGSRRSPSLGWLGDRRRFLIAKPRNLEFCARGTRRQWPRRPRKLTGRVVTSSLGQTLLAANDDSSEFRHTTLVHRDATALRVPCCSN